MGGGQNRAADLLFDTAVPYSTMQNTQQQLDTNYCGTTGTPEKLIYVDEYILKSGAVYRGTVKIGEGKELIRHGRGIQIWKDGAKYEGEFKNGKAEGPGIFYHANGDVYDGMFKQGKASGQGVYSHAGGS